MNNYHEFLESKRITATSVGMELKSELHPSLFEYQKAIVEWSLRKGRAALFEDCGLGKTRQQLEWARQVSKATDSPVLILAPLAVAPQTQKEGSDIGLDVKICESDADIENGINITNYEKLHKFSAQQFSGIVLDESSILKSFNGSTRNLVIESFGNTPYKLACTATPAPNDHMELGNHAEFLGVMSRTEMLSTFFVHDGATTSEWRLKGHAEEDFWKWVCSWAVMIKKPSDLGYSDKGFELPSLKIKHVTIDTHLQAEDSLFMLPASSLSERRTARKGSLSDRVEAACSLANSNNEQWLIWCDLNSESEMLAKGIRGAVEVAGRHDDEHRLDAMSGFTEGRHRVLVSKPSIAGWGMNWQHCHNMAFVGLSDSYEQFYQATRRCWRFGQKEPVTAHVITSSLEQAVVTNITRKQMDADKMSDSMIKHMKEVMQYSINPTARQRVHYALNSVESKNWEMRQGDCVDLIKGVESDSVHFSVFSPPFASLYTYSNSERDMGNCTDMEDFEKHFGFLVPELLRVTKPGRLVAFHCMNLPTSKERDGYIGIRDFRGKLINQFVNEGFIYHSEVCIWKDPVTAMQRTKALGLLHKQIKKDSCMSRMGIPDYLVVMRKPGDNPERVTHTPDNLPVDVWQRYASPVWMDINPSNTLQRESAREQKDERHICPLQLEVIQRSLHLWSNPGDLVLSPFAGIGSEGYQALKMDRRFLGFELKESYFKQACLNLKAAEMDTMPLFAEPTESRVVEMARNLHRANGKNIKIEPALECWKQNESRELGMER